VLDKLIDVLIECFTFFVPFVVLDEYERGVLLRFGRFKRELGPGFHWRVPFNIDNVLNDSVVPRTVHLMTQAVVTGDGRTFALGAIITAEIRDIRKALLDVENVDGAVKDSCFSTVVSFAARTPSTRLHTEEFSDEVTAACRKMAFRYGIEIHRVRFCEMAPIRAFRLVGGN
jgi:regulator of protease activity HflC (stomatin/prohibitin superfamily)